ncbi:MAG: hypothetical protein KatS3mg112_0235 [Thermogutta sp.]|nr:MAG: hypothetical protein KatS3mg112_0235 [Thermogutta sp.]
MANFRLIFAPGDILWYIAINWAGWEMRLEYITFLAAVPENGTRTGPQADKDPRR